MIKLAENGFQTALFVRDMGSALDFYQHTLGLESAGKDDDYTFGPLHTLKCGNGDLLLIEAKGKPPAGPSWIHAQLGFRYVVIPVTNLSELCQKLEEKEVKFTIHETQITPEVRIAMVEDPEGNNIQFMEQGE